MSLKILHTADLHLGARFPGLGDRGGEQRAQLLLTFERIVDLAVEEQVDLFLIAGDLFDSDRASSALVGRVARRIKSLLERGIEVCVAPGTHDPFGPASQYASAPFSDISGLTVFKREGLEPVDFPRLDCTVYGNANVRPFQNKYPLSGFARSDSSRWGVGIVHAGYETPDLVDDTYLVTGGQIASCGLDYLALGHYHSLSDRSRGGVAAFYCGSPEMVRLRKGDTGGVVLVEMDDRVSVREVAVGRRSFEEVRLRAEDLRSEYDISSILVGMADEDLALKLRIEGLRGRGFPSMESALEEFGRRYFFLDIEDGSVPAPETVDPSLFPEDSPAATYLRILGLRTEGASHTERSEILEAMQLGVFLLGGEGER